MSLLTCEWNKLAFANYIVPPEILQKYIPAHTKLDFYNGNCYVSLVGFQFKNVKISGVRVPLHTNFEEINLRFYVKRHDGQDWRKGTVFITEIADKAALSLLANSLLHEHYKTLPTRQEVSEEQGEISAAYSFKYEEDWQNLEIKASSVASPVEPDSEGEFITHRLWGYGKHSEEETNEYKISHPQWQLYRVNEYSIDIDFTKVFGPEFSLLNSAVPHSVILAEGSKVEVMSRAKL